MARGSERRPRRFFFSPLGYTREIRALKHLRDAVISVTTWQPTTA
jgi:hypothetical protein